MAPLQLLSDNGGEFVNKFVERVCKRHNVQQQTTFSYSPLGVIERFNKTIKEKMTKNGWKIHDLSQVLSAYNQKTTHSTTKRRPIEVHFALVTGVKGTEIIKDVYSKLVAINRKTNPLPEYVIPVGTPVTLQDSSGAFVVDSTFRDFIGGQLIIRYALRNASTWGTCL